MTQFLQSNVLLVVGAAFLLIILGVRTVTGDKDLRQDLRAAGLMLLAFLALRMSAWVLDGRLTGTPANLLRLAWMLAFAFGVIRAGVSLALWALRFRRSTPTPKIVRDILSFLFYALAALPIIKATLKVDLAGLIATSAILSVVLGFAMQDTLGNLFAGLSLQLERPFEVGDVVTVGQHQGRIAQIGWRATRIETFRGEHVTLPNNVIAKEAVINFSRGAQPIGHDVYLRLGYSAPPNLVKGAILDTLSELPAVLPAPTPHCRTWAYDESGMRYQVRYFVANYDDAIAVMEQLYTRLWYRFERDGIEIPLPQRVVHMRTSEAAPRPQPAEEILGLLGSVDLLALLGPADLRTLANEVIPRRFGADERVITAGEEGHSFYVVASGEVSVRAGSPQAEIARLGRGQYFGEMSLLTGDPRVATVVVLRDALLYEIGRPAFARILSSSPELAAALAELLARRRTELQAAAANAGATETTPEARRIFTRLRELFRLDEGA